MENLAGSKIAVFAFALVAAGWASYWPKIKAMAVPRRLTVYQIVMMLGASLGLWAFSAGVGVAGGLLAGTAMTCGVLFLVLSMMSGLPTKPLAVAVGEPVLDFEAPDVDGEIFSPASMIGRPFLIKFYRGHW